MSLKRLLVVAIVVAALLMGTMAHAETVFAVFGDTRPGPNYERLHITRSLCKQLVRHDPAFLLGTGDYIEGSTKEAVVQEQYGKFFEAISALNVHDIPVAFTTGNHDIRGSRRNVEIFEEYFGARYYSFDRANAHIIILDSETPGQQGRIKGEQWEWLVNDLNNCDSEFIFVALHRPLFPVDGHRGSSMDVDIPLRDRLHQLFVQHRVDAVFCGHEHLYHFHERDGVDYFITGGGGAPLYAKPANGGFYHYILVTVGEDTYSARVIKNDGTLHEVRP